MKNVTIKTKRFINLSINIITGITPVSINEEKIRKENVRNLFINTIYKQSECEDIYDKCLVNLKGHEKNIELIHEKALDQAFELLRP